MIKITTTLLFSILLFTACAERGTTLTPKSVEQKPVEKKTIICTKKSMVHAKKVQIKEVKNISSSTKSIVIVQKEHIEVAKSPIKEISPIDDDNLFTFTNDTKNKISGFFIFLVGLMILI